MSEEVLKKISRKERQILLVETLKKGEVTGGKSYSLNPLFDLVAEMMKLAYIAGANRTGKAGLSKSFELQDTGEILVEAINFSKDKGFKV